MTRPIIKLPCTAQELESALHKVCDHDGMWDANIRVVLVKPHGGYFLEFDDIETETNGETK